MPQMGFKTTNLMVEPQSTGIRADKGDGEREGGGASTYAHRGRDRPRASEISSEQEKGPDFDKELHSSKGKQPPASVNSWTDTITDVQLQDRHVMHINSCLSCAHPNRASDVKPHEPMNSANEGTPVLGRMGERWREGERQVSASPPVQYGRPLALLSLETSTSGAPSLALGW